jgi:hypothetical protein
MPSKAFETVHSRLEITLSLCCELPICVRNTRAVIGPSRIIVALKQPMLIGAFNAIEYGF